MEYAYKFIEAHEKSLLPDGFEGNVYNLSYKWAAVIPVVDKPMKIMEIGAYHGANICSLVKTYAKHPKSEIHAIDPWTDYSTYPEYIGEQPSNYSIFLKNISLLAPEDANKIYIHRMPSHVIDAHFEDETFDIIYIDGNHEINYVLQDAMIALRKLSPGGYLIFDDMQDKNVVRGMYMFLDACHHLLEPELQELSCQAYVKKRTSK